MNIWNLWEHQGKWGHNLIFDFDTRKVIGHLPNRYLFRADDEFRVKMQSGKIARFLVKEVTYFPDPVDMLSAKVEDIGYLPQENQEPNYTEEKILNEIQNGEHDE